METTAADAIVEGPPSMMPTKAASHLSNGERMGSAATLSSLLRERFTDSRGRPMTPHHRKRLSSMRDSLVAQLPVDDRFLAHLIDQEVLTKRFLERLKRQSYAGGDAAVRRAFVGPLVDAIAKRGERAYVGFIYALVLEQRFDLIAKLDPEESAFYRSNGWHFLGSTSTVPTQTSPSKTPKTDGGGGFSWKGATLPPALPPTAEYQTTSNIEIVFKKSSERYDGVRYYKMHSDPRGGLLIINNCSFDDADMYPQRDGSDVDGARLADLFGKLGFVLFERQHVDLTGAEISETVRRFCQWSLHDKGDCSVVAILTHGKDAGTLFGRDGNAVTVRDLLEMFHSSACPSLINKPKVFLIIACRGDQFDYGTSVRREVSSSSNEQTNGNVRDGGDSVDMAAKRARDDELRSRFAVMEASVVDGNSCDPIATPDGTADQADANPFTKATGSSTASSRSRPSRSASSSGSAPTVAPRSQFTRMNSGHYRRPDTSDFLLLYSATDNYRSLRNNLHGSWYVQEFIRAVVEDAHCHDLNTIATNVHRRVSNRQSADGEKSQPQLTHTLTKLLHLNPGYPRDFAAAARDQVGALRASLRIGNMSSAGKTTGSRV